MAASDDDDDLELELEPIDPEIVAAQRARAQEKHEAVIAKIDVDELYGDQSAYSDLDVDWTKLKQFRFTTRHLLILTAALAVVMTLRLLTDAVRTIALIAAVLLAAGWTWATILERRQEVERQRRRDEFFAGPPKPGVAPAAAPSPAPRPPRPPFKFAFSLKQLMIAMTVAAVAVGLTRLIGVNALALVFGMTALVGIIINAAGYDPPPQVVLGWWLMLVFYLVFGMFAVMSADANAARAAPSFSVQQITRA